MKYFYSKPMCSAYMERKDMLSALKIPFEERDGKRILEPEDEIDHEMFLKVARNGGNPASPELPQEIDV